MLRPLRLAPALLLLVAGCGERTAPATSTAPTGTASLPTFTRPEPSSPVAPEPTAGSSPDAAGSADGGPPSTLPDAGTPPSPKELPNVEITVIGMHVGGGPNDKETKAPIREAVLKSRDAFRACFGMVENAKKSGTFGVDVLIPAAGGRAEVTKPRSGLDGPGVDDCMMRAFEAIEFARPPKGAAMMVSVSLQLMPQR